MIYTMNGPIEKHQMGITFSHEHFKWEPDDGLTHALYYNHQYELSDLSERQTVIEPIVKDLRLPVFKQLLKRHPQ